MEKKKIAIACQGGGSQTAFTAGVLKALFDGKIQEKRRIVSLCGTSGGAVCALVAWYAMLKSERGEKTTVQERLMEFWKANSTQNIAEEMYNDSVVGIVDLSDSGVIPLFNSSPYSPVTKAMLSLTSAMLPRKEFLDFRLLLENHVDFDELDELVTKESPVLLVGSANVLEGEFKKFNSREKEIDVRAIMASSAFPTIFPAVHIGDNAYWDGMFSDNPPTDELLDPDAVGFDHIPQEIWVIQINPKKRKTIPESPSAIIDRRNEMVCNESLFQDLQKIEQFNSFLRQGAFKESFLADYHIKEPVTIRTVTMSEELQDRLDYASKLNRDADFIRMLIKDGEKQGKQFLKESL